MAALYHDGSRRLQDAFDTRRIADRLEQVTVHHTFTEGDRAFIERSAMFFLATTDADGWPDCSYKGGLPGFVRVVGPAELAFPSYDGNGMFRSLGNLLVNPKVGMLFVDFQHPDRIRINGTASRHFHDPLLQEFPRGAADGAGAGGANLPKLSALRAQDGAGEALGLRPSTRIPAAGAGLEAGGGVS